MFSLYLGVMKAAFLTNLDLVHGYWHAKVAEKSREKTAFFDTGSHFQFRRMPFGVTNAPATFQRALNSILSELNWRDRLVYLDNVIVYASCLEESPPRYTTKTVILEGNQPESHGLGSLDSTCIARVLDSGSCISQDHCTSVALW